MTRNIFFSLRFNKNNFLAEFFFSDVRITLQLWMVRTNFVLLRSNFLSYYDKYAHHFWSPFENYKYLKKKNIAENIPFPFVKCPYGAVIMNCANQFFSPSQQYFISLKTLCTSNMNTIRHL